MTDAPPINPRYVLAWVNPKHPDAHPVPGECSVCMATVLAVISATEGTVLVDDEGVVHQCRKER